MGKSRNKGVRPPAAGKGRPKGALNKFTLLKQDMLKAYNDLGGLKALVEWAEDNQSVFYGFLVKLLPKSVEVSGPDGDPIQTRDVTSRELSEFLSSALAMTKGKKE